MKADDQRQRGMTLLEVVVALMIFAIGCMAVIKTTGQQVRSLGELEARNLALWVADNQLALLQLDAAPPAPAWREGTTEMADEIWYWRYRGRETTDAGLWAIEIEVRCEPQAHNALIALLAYRELP
ncbi:type II secretion system minor pseudopilin GspI [Serratia entomophila]|uniref:type II secretion system minor pseudopilin GspI n=1 Tax=Serratia entomophila TaxID=42906 RepID=UPI002177B358|nr:type II secretion system minor pseudopilin GspI [Serratia entomophila]CAI1654513.1 Tfp pilus assembly protein PilV [Serratia entomophila]CAI1695091.1 Tfp pilus assembly protein PilV [Serratia entomophila]